MSPSDSVRAGLSGTNLECAGEYNQRVTLQAVRVNGRCTRADLVEVTGLTAPAIANITKRLLQDDLIVEVGKQQGLRGQPAMRLAINPDGCYGLGLNIDRDHISLVLLDLAGQVRGRVAWEVDFALPDAVAAFVAREAGPLIGAAGIDPRRVIGVGVAIPDDLGRVPLPHWPPGYAAWNGIGLAALLQPSLAMPVFIENDAAAAAMGELHFGHGLHHPNFFYLLVNLGLGGGLVGNGIYYRGADGRSGEIGFLPIGDGRSLQEAVSLSALYSQLEAAGVQVRRPDQLERVPAAAHEVLDRWIEQAAALLRGPLLAINCLINPEAVYIGGRLPVELIDRLAATLNAKLRQENESIPAIAPVLRAAMAADAPAIGAAMLPFGDKLLPSRTVLMKMTD